LKAPAAKTPQKDIAMKLRTFHFLVCAAMIFIGITPAMLFAATANPDAGNTGENTVLVVDAASGVTSNDALNPPASIPAFDAFSVAGGQVTVNQDGSYTYDPNGKFEALASGENALDTFTYTVKDTAGSDTATVTITIAGVNDAPTATDDTGAGFTTDEDTAFTTGDVRANDTDPDATDTLSVSALDTTGTQGSVTDNGNGTFDYDPNGQFENLAVGESTTDTFTYTLSDGNGGTDTATVTITITGANDAPTANDDSATTDENTSVTTGNVIINDSDPDTTDTLSVTGLDTTGTLGTVVQNGDKTFTYNPNGQFESLAVGESTTDTFTYTLSDGNGGTDTATVTITITGVNDVPTANGDSGAGFTTDEDTAFNTADVTDNDTDPDTSDSLSVSALDTTGTQGAVTGNGDGTFNYDPNGQFEDLAVGESANDTFAYTLSDGNGGTDTATVTIAVTGANDSPTAVADGGGAGFTTDEDTSFTTANVLTNDTDPDGTDTLSVFALDTTGTLGTVTNNGDGTFTYDPNGQFEGLAVTESATDTFSYTVSDGNGGTDTTTVTIDITGVNDGPTATDDSGAGFATDEDTSFTTANVLPNDTDPDGTDTLSVSALDTTGTLGTVTDNGDGTFTYDPNGQFEYLAVGESANDTFAYTVSDGNGGTDTATVTVAITGVNDIPTTNDDSGAGFETDEDTPFTTGDVLVNDTDPDTSDTLNPNVLDISGTIGSVTNNLDGTFDYDPNGQFEYLAVGESATDQFDYSVSDGNGGTDTATVTIAVTGVNDSPTAVADGGGAGFTTDEDTPFTTANVLPNDTDPDGTDTLSVFALDTTGTLGTVVNNGDGTFTYDPNGQFEGLAVTESATDTFSYTVSDGNGGTDTTTVTIDITGVNDGPTANDDSGAGFATDEDTSFTTANVLPNDTDPDGTDTLSVSALDTTGTLGTVTNNADGTFTYDPNVQFDYLAVGESATDTFTYTVSDGNGGTDTAVVTITITGINDGINAGDDSGAGFGTDEDTAFTTADVLANDADPDTTDTLSVSALDTTGTLGTVTDNGDGTFTYDPNGQFEDLDTGDPATDTFTYTVSDGNGATDTAVVTVGITGVNDTPTVDINLGLTVVWEDSTDNPIPDTRLSSSDVDGADTADVLTYTLQTPPAHGTLKLSGVPLAAGGTFTQTNIANGHLTYDHDGSDTTSDSFVFTVKDDEGAETGNNTFPISILSNFDLALTTTGSGIITAAPSGSISCGAGCTEYPVGTYVTLTPVPDAGWTFSGWSGALSGVSYPQTVIMDTDKTVGAAFVQTQDCTPEVNQVTDGTGWTYLGTYDFTGGCEITLTDESDGSTSFDAVRFVNGSGEVVIDDSNGVCAYAPSSDWSSEACAGCEGGSHHVTDATGDRVTITPGGLLAAGTYQVYVRWHADGTRDESAHYCVYEYQGHVITATKGENGHLSYSINGGTPVDVETGTTRFPVYHEGDDVLFTFTSDPDYHVEYVAVDGDIVQELSGVTTGTYTFPDVAADHDIEVSFAIGEAGEGAFTCTSVDQQADGTSWYYIGTYNLPSGTSAYVTLTNGGDGTVSLDAVKFAPADGSTEVVVDDAGAECTYSPDLDWAVNIDCSSCYDGGHHYTGVGGDRVTVRPSLPAAGEYDIFVRWKSDAYRDSTTSFCVYGHMGQTILATAGPDGVLVASGVTVESGTTRVFSVLTGTTLIFTAIADTGHEIQTIYVDGSEIAGISGVTSSGVTTFSDPEYFSNIQTSHTIEAFFGDHGFDCDSATLIDCGSGVSGTIMPAGDIDYFEVDITGAGLYTFYTTGGTDTYGTLLDTDCTPITTDDNSGTDSNFSIQYNLDPGTYHIAVEHEDETSGTGDYTLYMVCEHVIRATAHTGGRIDPAGTIVVERGSGVTFAITADSGNTIYDVEVDSTSIGGVSNYAFLNVTKNHTIEAIFSLPPTTCNDLSDIPMDAVVSGAPPIIMFVLDDSGSMDWEFMTREGDGIFAGEYYVFDDPGDNLYSSSYIIQGNERGLWKGQWSGYNRIYYDPEAYYVPWPTLPDADPDTPRSHPYHATDTCNLSDTYYSVMPGVIVDNVRGPSFAITGTWYTSGGAYPYGANASWYSSSNGATATWTATLPSAGNYEVFVWYTDSGDRDSSAPYIVNHAGGSSYGVRTVGPNTYAVDQDEDEGTWVSIGTYAFNAGPASVSIRRYNNGTNPVQPPALPALSSGTWKDHDSYTVADAVAFVPAGASQIDIPRAHYYTFADLDDDNELESGETVYLVCLNSATSSIDYYEVNASDDMVSSGDLTGVTEANVHVSARPKNSDGSFRSYAQERQNFANWYSFYRRRELTAIAAISRTIYDLDEVYVGFRSINGAIKQPALPINVDGESNLSTLLTKLYSHVGSAWGTPLRRGFEYVGKYLNQEDSTTGDMGSGVTNIWRDDNHGGNCQQAFAIVMTDGYYNGYSPSVSNADGNDGSPYADSYYNTLADVAMYYYERDLVSGVTNNVPTNPYDDAYWQHMVTYGVSFGVQGSLDQSLYETTSGTTNPPPWPNPAYGDLQKIDDLWHATVNGRGEFLKASNPDELVDALQAIVSNISERTGSAASVSINGDQLFAVLGEETRVFQARFSSGTKSGDVLAYTVDMDNFEVETDTPVWSASEELDDRIGTLGHTDRVIATYSLTGGVGGIPFTYSGISSYGSAEQMVYLTPDWSASATASTENLVNYLRGNRGHEMSSSGGVFRRRVDGVLGDIVNSSPYYYMGVLYTGGNDGMLHAFDAETGKELFAYVPGLIYDHLKDYADPGYQHYFYVDLTPFVQPDVDIGGTEKTVLVGGLRKGGKGYFALDISGITNTASFNNEIPTEWDLADRVLWEYPDSGTTTAEIDDLGFSYSKAYIAKSNDTSHAEWVVIFGNGYNSENSSAVLVILDPTTGDLLKSIDTGVTNCNGLSSPALVDVNSDNMVDYVYAGDLKGNLWKFDLTSTDYNDWGVAFGDDKNLDGTIDFDDGDEPHALFQAVGDTGPQPITTQPDVMFHCGHPDRPGYMVVFGTGKYMGESDITNVETQSLYGIWDFGDDSEDEEFPGEFTRIGGADRLQVFNPLSGVTRTLLKQTATDYAVTAGSEELTVRVLSDNDPDWKITTTPDGGSSCGDYSSSTEPCDPECTTCDADPLVDVGWFLDLPDAGERVINDILIRVGILYSTTFVPTEDPCGGEGYSFPMFTDPCTGGNLGTVVLDINGDNIINSADQITIGTDAEGNPITATPSGRRFEGRLQRQTFVRANKDGQSIDVNIFSSSKGDPSSGDPSSGGGIETQITTSPAMGVIYWKDLIN